MGLLEASPIIEIGAELHVHRMYMELIVPTPLTVGLDYKTLTAELSKSFPGFFNLVGRGVGGDKNHKSLLLMSRAQLPDLDWNLILEIIFHKIIPENMIPRVQPITPAT